MVCSRCTLCCYIAARDEASWQRLPIWGCINVHRYGILSPSPSLLILEAMLLQNKTYKCSYFMYNLIEIFVLQALAWVPQLCLRGGILPMSYATHVRSKRMHTSPKMLKYDLELQHLVTSLLWYKHCYQLCSKVYNLTSFKLFSYHMIYIRIESGLFE